MCYMPSNTLVFSDAEAFGKLPIFSSKANSTNIQPFCVCNDSFTYWPHNVT